MIGPETRGTRETMIDTRIEPKITKGPETITGLGIVKGIVTVTGETVVEIEKGQDVQVGQDHVKGIWM